MDEAETKHPPQQCLTCSAVALLIDPDAPPARPACIHPMTAEARRCMTRTLRTVAAEVVTTG